MQSDSNGPNLRWLLVYTKPRAERWAEANLRRQGYATLLPRIAARSGDMPLFPRYVFVGCLGSQRVEPLRSTSGVSHTVSFGDRAAIVRPEIIDEVRSRMDAHGLVTIDARIRDTELFGSRQRERVRTLLKLAEAGYRVRVA